MSVASYASASGKANAAKTATPAAGGLRIGDRDDAFEREADRVADAITSGRGVGWSLAKVSLGGDLRRKCDCVDAAGGECGACRETRLRRQCTTNSVNPAEPSAEGQAPAIVHEVLRSPGQPLDPSTRAFFEGRFGVDFARIRIHADSKARESVRAVNALAYTVGQHIAFAPGRYSPESSEGRRLIAHELTHSVQQLPVSGPALPNTRAPATQLTSPSSDGRASAGRPLIAHADRRGRLARQSADAGAAQQVPLPTVEKTEAEKLKEVGNSEEYGREGNTWGWGAPETNNVYQRCVIAPLARAKFLAFVKSLPRPPWHGRKPPKAEEVLGITNFDSNAAKPPEIAAVSVQDKGKAVFKLKPTHAEMPPIRSAFTQAGAYDEDVVHNADAECAAERRRLGTGAFPVHWTITPDGAQKTREAEQEHCNDIRAAFDLTLGLYASAINNLAASERTYSHEADVVKEGVRATGVTPEEMVGKFYQMALQTKRRDDTDWHTAHPIGDPGKKDQPRKQGCQYFFTVNASSWPEIGVHTTAEVMEANATAKPAKKAT